MAWVLKWSRRKQLPQILKCEVANTESTLVCVAGREMLEATGKLQKTLRWLKALRFSLKQSCLRERPIPAVTTNRKNPHFLGRNSRRERGCICVNLLWERPFVWTTSYKPALSVKHLRKGAVPGSSWQTVGSMGTKLQFGSQSSVTLA